ncbi:hypothetical protein HOG21_04840 [bacterium]|nr:hypothetical protein [bacterium]
MFLKLSSISLAIFFHHNQNASHHDIASIDTNHINIVFVISVAIHILSSTTIKVKNSIIIFAQIATILAVFCLLKSRAW